MKKARPTLGQKVAKLIAESPYKNPLNFHKEIVRIFGQDAISQRHLYNIVNDSSKQPRDPVLYQIALPFEMEIHQLLEGTTSEPADEGPSRGIGPFGPESDPNSAILHNLYYGLPFKPQLIILKRKGKTLEEREEIPGHQCFKFITVTRGEIDLVIKHQEGNTERIKLKLHHCHCFNSGDYHYIENSSRQFATVILIRFTKPA